MKIKLNQIKANSWNSNFLNEQEKEALKQCLIQAGPEKTLPIIIRPIPEKDHYCYEIIDGEHRWTIAKELGWEKLETIILQADDLQARAYCVSYNKWRGRFNWFKLHDIIKKDQDNGINIEETYKDALTNKELKHLLSLDNFVPKARLSLEDSLKKHPEFTLEQLHLLSKFPADQQESLSETYKKPLTTHLLTRLLTPFLQKNQPTTASWPNRDRYLPNGTQNQPNTLLHEKTINPHSNNTNHNTNTIAEQQDKPPETFETDNLFSQAKDFTKEEQETKNTRKEPKAVLLAVGYNCNCGKLYQVNFKKSTIITQKENLLFEHIDFKTNTFLVHCNHCDNDHEFTAENMDSEGIMPIFCNRCNPNRKGLLNVNTKEVTWL
ncbi:MAG: ParB/RepB/Spo0J family partition protein [Candidatus Bathyarchaeota archaeon]|nr:ParB/RepB/Spo0J family partition protein [Candidatus Termiticorpusculum sp.]